MISNFRRMSKDIVIRFQKASGEVEKDDVVFIHRSHKNERLFSITSRAYNAKTAAYSGLFSHNDMHVYLETLFNVALSDMSDDCDQIIMIQYDIPGFPSVVVPVEAFWDDDVYDTFTNAVEFWATTM
jgi:hypothetical protein